jgi:predicted nucleic acid-binding protein
MIVVSDTSPLNYLVLIQRADILPALFGQVVAPPAVMAELQHPGAPAAVRAWADAPPAWLEIRTPLSVIPDLGLGPGESEAISLATEIGASAVLIDERKGMAVAKRLGLFATGTLGVLEMAAANSDIDLVEAIELLRGTNFRASAELFDEILDRDRKRTK